MLILALAIITLFVSFSITISICNYYLLCWWTRKRTHGHIWTQWTFPGASLRLDVLGENIFCGWEVERRRVMKLSGPMRTFLKKCSCELHARFLRSSHEVHMHFVCTSYELHVKFMRTSHVVCTKCMWTSCELHRKYVWSTCEVHVKFTRTALIFNRAVHCCYSSWH